MMKRFLFALMVTSFTGVMADDYESDCDQTPEERFAGVTDHESNDVADHQKKPEVSGKED